jgi:hypothetical protein
MKGRNKIMKIEDVKEGQEIKIRFWNGDNFTGVVKELTPDYIAMNLSMCINFEVIKLNREWIDDIELAHEESYCAGIEVNDDYLKLLEKFGNK